MWYLDSTRLYVQELQLSDTQIIARLQPLSDATIHQVFGYESPIIKAKAIVVGTTDRDAIRAMVRDASTHDLDFDGNVFIGSALIRSANWTKIMSICQTLRPDLPDNAAVYSVDLELYVDE